MSYGEEHVVEEYEDDQFYNDEYSDADHDDHISYNDNDFISKPVKSPWCTIDENILRLHYSFGYESSKIFNLCAADDHTIVYAAGSYIAVFDVKTGSLYFRKCAGNGGIGHITKNPVFGHLAIGENCNDPLIIVYQWPTLKIVSVLKGSAKKKYNWLTYSQNGKYLCSQAGEPDNMLTIWDWKKSRIIQKAKSHTQDVHVCRFSSYIPEHLVTAGSGHIKFWKMAQTFTGLKLQGYLGRFGKTDISDVVGILSMPDEKVISSCNWGNVLVWDESLVALEVMRKERKPCHLAPIIMLLNSEFTAELITVGMDGTIKFWYYPTIEDADPPENDRVLEMEPSFIINVQDSMGTAKITGICKLDSGNPSSQDYFIQDSNGGLWLVDIKVTANAKPLKRLAKFHGDQITSLQASPVDYFIATTSLDGWLHVYDVVNKKLIFMHNFAVPITSSIWLPLKISNLGNIFVIGFQTGILKTVSVSFTMTSSARKFADIIGDKNARLTVLQSSKPHTNSIRHLVVNRGANVLVCGSDDHSIFMYKIETGPFKLKPIGTFLLSGKVTFIHWKPSEKQTALISCDSGHIVEVKVPKSRPLYTKNSFLLQLESRTIKTVSIKSELIRDEFIKEVEKKKKEKIDKKREKLQIIRAENAGVEIDEELYLQDSEEDEEIPKLFVPAIPNPILFAVYTPSEKSVWVSIDGYDAGYLYEYDFNSSKPIESTRIPGLKNSIPLTAINTLASDDESITILLGFADGKIRVVNVNVDDLTDFNDYIEYSIHDNITGRIQTICFSQDNQNLTFSLEETKVNKERYKNTYLANKEKERVIFLLHTLKEQFKQVFDANKALPKRLQFPQDYFQLHEKIDDSLILEAQSEMDKLHARFEFDYEKSLLSLNKVKNYFVGPVVTAKYEVRAVLQTTGVKTIYHKDHQHIYSNLVEEFISKKHKTRRPHKLTVLLKSNDNPSHNANESEIFLRNMLERYQFFPKKIQIAIDKYCDRITYENEKLLNIEMFEKENRKDSDNNNEDYEIENARETIGDFKLKTSPHFKPSDEQKVSMEDKYEQFLYVKEELNSLKSSFNVKIADLRQRKIQLLYDYKQFKFDINRIKNELGDEEITSPPNFPEVLVDESIDPNLIDSYEEVYHPIQLDFILNPRISQLYVKSKNDSNEKSSYLEPMLQKMLKDNLKYKHKCLHESMLTKITMFDDQLFMLKRLRKDVKSQITFLELFSLTLEDELLILNDYNLLEDEYAYRVHIKTGQKNAKIDKIMQLQDDIGYYKQIINDKLNAIEDIQRSFELEIQYSDKFAKLLRAIFKKKLKIPKVKTEDDDDSSSSSSSDDSDDSDSETENVKIEECDPAKLAFTIELRSKRYEILKNVDAKKMIVESRTKSLVVAYTELKTIENELKNNLVELEVYQIQKQLKLNDVDMVIVFYKSQMAEVKLLKNSVLVYSNLVKSLMNRVNELKKESEDIQSMHSEEQNNAKKSRKEIIDMNLELKNYKEAIKYEMEKKFKTTASWSFIDNMERTLINYMIICSNSNRDEMIGRSTKEIKLLKKQISDWQEILVDLLAAQTIKNITLNSVRVCYWQTQRLLSVQHQNSIKLKHLTEADESNTSDLDNIKDIYSTLLKRKEDLCKEIQSLNQKGKTFHSAI
ncbi:WD40/YVTN repeat-like-containing domain,WD40-repeat-containing domain,WD40 repeat [Cinara cedri]|uniref:WD40/YVTN repeat-like-containing domain,WD40-repeat-containing domain,WD40 repeat n=1 Tax=Cinara cedri TaxID=506608 RepID=A0A5E4MDS2_9HEMI|nr:WD40/YVTN repeat-like-containing domain,WD40-repeat-containing domain,WD40 repeat [Cinara cedri]